MLFIYRFTKYRCVCDFGGLAVLRTCLVFIEAMGGLSCRTAWIVHAGPVAVTCISVLVKQHHHVLILFYFILEMCFSRDGY